MEMGRKGEGNVRGIGGTCVWVGKGLWGKIKPRLHLLLWPKNQRPSVRHAVQMKTLLLSLHQSCLSKRALTVAVFGRDGEC